MLKMKILIISSSFPFGKNEVFLENEIKYLKQRKNIDYEIIPSKKDSEINKLNFDHQKFKNEIEANQKKYEKLIDEAADQISNFVKNTKLENLSQ